MKKGKNNLAFIILGLVVIIGILALVLLFKTTNTGNYVTITPDEACNRIVNKCKGPGYFMGMYQNFAMCVCHRDVVQFNKGIPVLYNQEKVYYISLERKY